MTDGDAQLSGYDLPLNGWVCLPRRHVNVAPDRGEPDPSPPATCALGPCSSKQFEPIPLNPTRRPT